ncbi:hypothetical protein Tco_1327169 [Tanacetum coccineum]
MFWHTARDDPMFNTIRVISRHQDTQIYGAILPDELNNQEMLDSKAYKEYYAIAFGVEPPKAKTKYKKKVDEPVTPSKSKNAPASKGSRLKSPAKVAKTDKKKQRAMMPKTKGLAVLSKVALTEAEQIKLATKRSKKDFHMSHASGSGDGVDIQLKVPDEQQQKITGINEGAGVRPESDMNDDSEETKSDNDGDNLTHPNLSTYKADDQEEEEEKANDDEVSFDQRVLTPQDYELTDEEENKEGDDKGKEGEQEQDEEDDMYRDVNINLERSDTEMTDAQANKDTKDTHVTLTAVPLVVQQQSSFVSSDLVSKFINPSPDIGIDSILNPNIQSHTLVNVPVSITAETPSSDTTLPPPPIPKIQTLQQTPSSITKTTIPIIAMPDIPDFASVFQFDQRVSALETEMSEFKQTNQFVEVVSSILGIMDNYLSSKMKDAVDVAAQLQTNKLKEEAQAENQTSYAVAASLSEFELKKILIDKMDENKSINRSDIQKNLYNTLVESYNSDKDIISSYGDVVTLKRGRDGQDKDEDPSARSNRGSKRRRPGKEAETSKEPTHKESKSTGSSKGATRSQPKSLSKSAHAEEHGQKVDDLEDQSH